MTSNNLPENFSKKKKCNSENSLNQPLKPKTVIKLQKLRKKALKKKK